MEEGQSARKRSDFGGLMPEDWGPLPDSHRWIVRLFLLLIANLLLCVAVALWIGRDAISGYTQNGQFFLGNHGKLTEVNGWIYLYSLVHILSVIVSFPIMAFCWLAIRGYRVP